MLPAWPGQAPTEFAGSGIMAAVSERTGYSNALTSTYFKTTPDGRRLFYPWGAMSRGYAIPSEDLYNRLHRRIKIYQVVSLVAIIGAVVAQYYLASFVIATLLIATYAAWTPYLVRGLQPSDVRLSRQESMTTQARVHGAVGLWLLEIAALVFVAGGVAMLVLEPGRWLTALAVIVFFGLCAAVGVRMLVLHRRAAGGRS
jgi:hypothetical protein